MPAPFTNLVVLMLENRSFDHMLGFLKSDTYRIEGLNGNETNPNVNEGPDVKVSGDARTVHDLNPDPGHEFVNVNVQIFGNSAGTETGPLMQGFVQDYALVSNHAEQGANIMKCFQGTTLPVLSTLAQQYAVCDHWFSSVPGPTIPNRLFSHGASSVGSLTQDVIVAPAALKTIFEVINDRNNPNSFRIYTAGSSLLMANLYLAHYQEYFHDYADFKSDCANGELPAYTFIEPCYDDDLAQGVYANSQHPDFPVDEGEGLISDVYYALRQSPQWNSTLLLIVYDEHGGIFDHVPPPTLTRNPIYDNLPDVPHSKNPVFAFDRLGVRVPAVFVSPYIKAGTILSQPFDHCSIVATVRKLFCLDKTPFNWREAQAETFENILNLDVARLDTVHLPDPFVSSGIAAPAALPATAAFAAAATAATATTASAAPKTPPTVRKPTDLALNMARAMEYSLGLMGLHVGKSTAEIYSAQDATNYLNAAAALLKSRGRAKAAGLAGQGGPR